MNKPAHPSRPPGTSGYPEQQPVPDRSHPRLPGKGHPKEPQNNPKRKPGQAQRQRAAPMQASAVGWR